MMRPGDVAAVNVLLAAFTDWKTEYSRTENFPALNDTAKRFRAIVMRRP